MLILSFSQGARCPRRIIDQLYEAVGAVSSVVRLVSGSVSPMVQLVRGAAGPVIQLGWSTEVNTSQWAPFDESFTKWGASGVPEEAKVAVIDVTMDVLGAESYGVYSVLDQYCVIEWYTVSRGYCDGTVTRWVEVGLQ
ncbi:uncharacterized protein G2W53_033511 [Senna tora]|uniref:Uncharacterized protein n=1 Tax=Senna tora TaxID=362788 RepID=A0A834T0P8_9FABA|nr:uncharacterized protein G2W53_033511 [Senna tora]